MFAKHSARSVTVDVENVMKKSKVSAEPATKHSNVNVEIQKYARICVVLSSLAVILAEKNVQRIVSTRLLAITIARNN